MNSLFYLYENCDAYRLHVPGYNNYAVYLCIIAVQDFPPAIDAVVDYIATFTVSS